MVTEQQLDDLAALLIPRLRAIADIESDPFISEGTREARRNIERRRLERQARNDRENRGRAGRGGGDPRVRPVG